MSELGLNRADLKIKRYSRAIKEIRNNLTSTQYIPKFDAYGQKQKMDFLIRVEGLKNDIVEKMTEEQINVLFDKKIHKKIDTLEEDVGSVS